MSSSLVNVLQARMKALNDMDASQLAARSGVPKQTLSYILNGKIKDTPSIETLAKIAKGLEMPLADLIEAVGFEVGKPTQGSNAERLARLFALVPWMSDKAEWIASLPEDEFQEMLRYMEYRADQQRQKKRAEAQTKRESHDKGSSVA